MAVENDFVDVARYLIEKGARTDIFTSPSNRSAEQYVISDEMREIFDGQKLHQSFKRQKSKIKKSSEWDAWGPSMSTSASWPKIGRSESVQQMHNSFQQNKKNHHSRRSHSVNTETPVDETPRRDSERSPPRRSRSPEKRSRTPKRQPQPVTVPAPQQPTTNTPFASKIAQLMQLKDLAVKEERYTEAQRHKDRIDELRRSEGEIRQLDDRKRDSIRREQYIEAQQIKDKIDEIMKTAFGSLEAATTQPHEGENRETVRLPPI
jgi:hypothetical protein